MLPTARVYHAGTALYRFGMVYQLAIELHRPEGVRVWDESETNDAMAEVEQLLTWIRDNQSDIGGLLVYWRERPEVDFSSDDDEAFAVIRISVCDEYPRG